MGVTLLAPCSRRQGDVSRPYSYHLPIEAKWMSDRVTSPRLRELVCDLTVGGARKEFRIRATAWNGSLWMIGKDVAAALGWSGDKFRQKREETLVRSGPETAGVIGVRSVHMMNLVPRNEVMSILEGSINQRELHFRVWLDGLNGTSS